MIAAVPRALLVLAVSCLGGNRREWGLAMQAEFQAAEADGKPLSFAGGCLLAALRELPAHAEGRFFLLSNLIAFTIIIPISALLVSALLAGHQVVGPSLSEANVSAVPSIGALVVCLAAAQLRLAWLVLERDWARVAAAGALIAASTVALFIFAAVVFAHFASVLLLAALLGAELAAISALARWHGRSFDGVSAAPA